AGVRHDLRSFPTRRSSDLGCNCKVCLSQDPKDTRFRASVLITTEQDRKILIDCGPDFRQQMLMNKEQNVEAILLTHEHNDHIIGDRKSTRLNSSHAKISYA